MVASPYINLDDTELMLKYQNGDHMAFDVLYYRHKDKVYSYLVKRLHSQDEIDDIYQKVFEKFHKSRGLYKEKYNVLPWIYTITKSVFLDSLKKKKLNSIELDEQIHGYFQGEQEKVIDIDDQPSLSEKEKKALNQRYYNEQDFIEIARLLETSESNARKIISRGLKKLRDKYRGENHD